jgi:hypothetical protein
LFLSTLNAALVTDPRDMVFTIKHCCSLNSVYIGIILAQVLRQFGVYEFQISTVQCQIYLASTHWTLTLSSTNQIRSCECRQLSLFQLLKKFTSSSCSSPSSTRIAGRFVSKHIHSCDRRRNKKGYFTYQYVPYYQTCEAVPTFHREGCCRHYCNNK